MTYEKFKEYLTILDLLKGNGHADVTFTADTREDAVKIITKAAQELDRQWEAIESRDGGTWYTLVTHSKDNFQVSVFVNY